MPHRTNWLSMDEAVAAGARLLDRHTERWWDNLRSPISLAGLDACAIGQTQPRGWADARVLYQWDTGDVRDTFFPCDAGYEAFWQWCSDHGFNYCSQTEIIDLNQLWEHAVSERRLLGVPRYQ